jgi:hypothetical protein
MNDLSILKTQQELNTESAQSEIANAFLRSLASYVPSIGPFLAQVIGVVIPNQKMDRLVAFAKVLGDRIKYLEDDIVKLRMETPEFTDLLEDGLVQASRALTDERRQYIAALLTTCITSEALAHLEEKKLLWLLGELNDAEVLTLKFFSLSLGEKQGFATLHKELFAPLDVSFGAPELNVDKGALRNSYRNRLLELGLLEPAYKKPETGKVPEFDVKTGRLKATDLRVTRLGKLLLRYVEHGAPIR